MKWIRDALACRLRGHQRIETSACGKYRITIRHAMHSREFAETMAVALLPDHNWQWVWQVRCERCGTKLSA